MILIGAAANALLNIVFIPVYGIAGAAFATSFSYFLILLLSTSKVIYYIQAPRPYKDWIKLTIPAATFVGVIYLSQKHLYFAPWIKLLVSFPAAIMIYFLQLYLFNLINLRELKYYFMQLRKKDLPPPKQYANP